jgi:hypothetical protein
MKIGAEDKKKVYLLAALGVGALYGMYSAFSGPSIPAPKPAAPRDPTAIEQPSLPAPAESAGPAAAPRSRVRNAARNEEFHPVLRSKRKEDQIDPFTIDPEIKLYILARLQEVPAAGGGRNLFQFGATPPVELPKGPEPTVKVAARLIGPPLVGPPPPPPGPPPPPPPAPFNAKYYGLATAAANGSKRAFFLDGEDIIIKSEGETVKGHFRVVRIGLTSVVVEDTENKRQQTVQIAEDAQG